MKIAKYPDHGFCRVYLSLEEYNHLGAPGRARVHRTDADTIVVQPCGAGDGFAVSHDKRRSDGVEFFVRAPLDTVPAPGKLPATRVHRDLGHAGDNNSHPYISASQPERQPELDVHVPTPKPRQRRRRRSGYTIIAEGPDRSTVTVRGVSWARIMDLVSDLKQEGHGVEVDQ